MARAKALEDLGEKTASLQLVEDWVRTEIAALSDGDPE
jgi:hypothetical protein